MCTWKSIRLLLSFALLAGALVVCGCGGGDDDGAGGTSLLDTQVAVGAGGGSATVFFQGQAGQSVRITLSGPAGTAPYGFLEPPGGEATYTPPNNGNNGGNQADVNLTVTGQFSLTIFDGNNVGGVVNVQVTVIA